METSKLEISLVWAGRAVSVLISLLFAWSASMKLMAHPSVFEGMNHMGLPVSLMLPLGILELSCVVMYLIPMTSVLGAVLFTGYVGGAILTHLRIGEPVYMQILFGILVWLGLWLREPRLRALLPLRSPQ
jgi:hypothetical protein